jgi:hypothetical protein
MVDKNTSHKVLFYKEEASVEKTTFYPLGPTNVWGHDFKA